MADFKLSAQLVGHESDVRAVAFPNSDTVLTTSRDNTIRLWRKDTPNCDSTIITQGSEYINSLAYLPPSSDFPDGLIIAGSKDGIIDVRKLDSHQGDHSLFMMIGHSNNVCALDVFPGGKHIVSGGWDGQGRVWSVGKWETEVELLGHNEINAEHKSVLAVAAVDSQTVFTGCADRMIRAYALKKTRDGKCLPVKTIITEEPVRALCALPKGHASGAHIASAGNDGVIRLWSADGTQVAELHGHTSYIYSLACMPSGELVSSGEDRTVRIWKGTECIQTITHPAISVWSVAVCHESGDIVSGASDNIARIFTRHSDRVADAETISQFQEAVQTSAIPQQQMPQINKEKLNGPEYLETNAGVKDGQNIMIKQPDGSVTAHMWSMGDQKWNLVGTVVDSAASGAKTEYEGKQYDYVFEVDIEDGKPKLKLPYNLSENPYDAARRFLENNDLPVTYLESVARFITDNTKGATLDASQSSQPTVPTVDQTMTDRKPEASTLPHKSYLLFQNASLGPLQKKLLQLNETKIATKDKDYTMGSREVKETLGQLAMDLTEALDKTPGELSSTAAGLPQPIRVEPEYRDLVIKTGSRWAYGQRLPGLDLIRCCCLSKDLATFEDDRGDIMDIIVSAATTGTEGADPKQVANSLMMTFRAVANLFASKDGQIIAARKAGQVVELMELITGVSEMGVGDLKGSVGMNNRNLLIAMASAAVNYSVLALAFPALVEEDSLVLLINVLGKIISTQTDSETVFRALVALGNIVGAEQSHAEAAKALSAMEWLIKAHNDSSEARVKSLAKTIQRMLS